jgi:hypothetical protein
MTFSNKFDVGIVYVFNVVIINFFLLIKNDVFSLKFMILVSWFFKKQNS